MIQLNILDMKKERKRNERLADRGRAIFAMSVEDKDDKNDGKLKEQQNGTERGLQASKREVKEIEGQRRSRKVIVEDEAKLKKMKKLCLTLEMDSDYNDVQDKVEENSQHLSFKYYLTLLGDNIKLRFFQMNHLLLSNQLITMPLYQLVLLVEFLQLMFFIFFRVYIRNEFKSYNINQTETSAQEAQTNSTINNNITQGITSNNGSESLVDGLANTISSEEISSFQQIEVQVTTIHQYFEFINFYIYSLTNQDTSDQYVTTYILFVSAFTAITLILLIVSPMLYQEEKRGNIKDGVKYIMKVAALGMTLIIKLFELPFITMLLYGYVCEDGVLFSQYALTDISCDSQTHSLLIGFSTIMLILYYSFIVFENQFFLSHRINETLPWAGFDRSVTLFRSCYKFMLACFFVFGKDSSILVHALILLACGLISLLALSRRLTSAFYFEKYIYFAKVIYEAIICCLFIMISIHELISESETLNQLSLSSLVSVSAAGITLASLFLYLQRIWLDNNALHERDSSTNLLGAQNLGDIEIQLTTLFQIITRNSMEDQMKMHALLQNHAITCSKYQCKCYEVLAKTDSMKKFQKWYEMHSKDFRKLQSDKMKMDKERSGQALGTIFEEDHNSDNQSINASTFSKKLQKSQVSVGGTIIQEEGSVGGTTFAGILSSIQKQNSVTKSQQEEMDLEALVILEKDEAENLYDEKKAQKGFYVYLTQIVRNIIEKNPREVFLRLIYITLLKDCLKSPFKAVFELLNCKSLTPNLQQKFEIFRHLSEIEYSFMQQAQHESGKQLDVTQVYIYERMMSQYLINEYQAVHYSLSFWKELMQKNLEILKIHKKGIQISRALHNIQDISSKFQKEFPNDFAFMFRYAVFLLRIINNEYDASQQLKSIQTLYESKTTKKTSGGSNTVAQSQSEQQLFGQNTASGVLILSANSFKIGTIRHANQEMETLLGYKKYEIQGQSVSIMMPALMRLKFDKIAQKVIESGKGIHRKTQGFALNTDGYIVPVEVMLKIYPEIKGEMVFVAFIQKSSSFNQMQPVRQEFQHLDANYIVTDSKGFISDVSSGLQTTIGLHSKFFSLQDISSVNKVLSIWHLCPSISYPDVSLSFDVDAGQILQFDTSDILNQVDTEYLHHEDMLEIRSILGKYDIYTQFVEWVLAEGEGCTLHIYRVIVIQRSQKESIVNESVSNPSIAEKKQTNSKLAPWDLSVANYFLQQAEGQTTTNQNESGTQMSHIQRSASMGSFSSTSGSSTSSSTEGIIRDFKRKINERHTPTALLFLNRLIVVIIFGTILLTVLDFSFLSYEVSSLGGELEHNLFSERRSLELVELASNVRSMINVANRIEFDKYEIHQLNEIGRSRYSMIQSFVQSQAEYLKGIHDHMTQQRTNDDAGSNVQQNKYEYEKIVLYKLDNQNHISEFLIQFRVAFYQYLNEIQSLNQTQPSDLWLPNDVIKGVYVPGQHFNTNFTEKQRTAYFLINNGLRSLRVKTRLATEFQQLNAFNNITSNPFLIMMIIAIVLSFFSLMVVLYQIHAIETILNEILSLYALMSEEHLQQSYDRCGDYFQILNHASLNDLLSYHNIKIDRSVTGEDDHQYQDHGYDDMSEEEKDQRQYRDYIKEKRSHPSLVQKKSPRYSENDEGFYGKEIYAKMIKRLHQELKLYQVVQDSNRKDKVEEEVVNEYNRKKSEIKIRKVISKNESHDLTKLPGKNVSQSQLPWKQKDRSRLVKRFSVKENIEEEKKHEDEEISLSEEDDIQKAKQQNRLKRLSKLESKSNENNIEQKTTLSLQEQRKQAFKETIRSGNNGLKIINAVVTTIFCGYFILTYLYHENYKDNLQLLQSSIPIFFSRYRYLMLTYSLLRERIMANNSLSTFEENPGYGTNLDRFVHDRAINNEKQLQILKVQKPAILEKIVEFLMATDSPKFCESVIGQSTFLEQDQQESNQIGRGLKTTAYQTIIDTVMKACIAAYYGDLQTIIKLKEQGVNLNNGDYDASNPLYYAIRGEQIAVVKYLLKLNINMNIMDRWDGTALNYAVRGSEIEKLLIQKGAKRGVNQTIIPPPLKFNLTDNDLRLLFSASQGNLKVLEILQHQSWRVNTFDLDGRSPLHLAACANSLETVKFLVTHGADVMFKDIRGNTPVDDAIREGNLKVTSYLNQTMAESIIKQNCKKFADGIFTQGVLSAIGTFRKKYEDIQILINQTGSYPKMMTLLQGSRYANISKDGDLFDIKSIKLYFQAQELYISRIVEKMIESMSVTESDYSGLYHKQMEGIFAAFIILQLLVLFFFRRRMINKMKREVFENRGILNLIPGHVFDQNKQEVEALIKKIKD